MAMLEAFSSIGHVFSDFQDMLTPVACSFRPLNATTPRIPNGGPNYVAANQAIVLDPAYILRQPKRILKPDSGDEVTVPGTVYCALEIIVPDTALLVLPEGNRKIVRVDQYSDEAGAPGVQAVYFQ